MAFVSSVGKVAMPFIGQLEDGNMIGDKFLGFLTSVMCEDVDTDLTFSYAFAPLCICAIMHSMYYAI